MKRFIQAERRKNTTMVDHSNESTTIATSSKNKSIRTAIGAKKRECEQQQPRRVKGKKNKENEADS